MHFSDEATFFVAECPSYSQERYLGDLDPGVIYTGTSGILNVGGLLPKDSAILFPHFGEAKCF